jgi:4-diphosphocytidyl-2-C-methyl-D-erythritol kinase
MTGCDDANMAAMDSAESADGTAPETLRLIAPAKLTIALKVTGIRPDGYHLLDAEMVSLDLADIIELTPDSEGLEVTGPYSVGLSAGGDNLVTKALGLAGRRAAVRLIKNIPHGGGLGGGSSDAAAILRWAGALDPITASDLGADVPFCLCGGRARVTGIGEQIEPLDYVQRTFTLVMPPFPMSTPEVYRAWDALGGPSAPRNDLEPAALSVDERLGTWRGAIERACGLVPRLAGSGSTWFVDGDHETALSTLRTRGATILVVNTTDRVCSPS